MSLEDELREFVDDCVRDHIDNVDFNDYIDTDWVIEQVESRLDIDELIEGGTLDCRVDALREDLGELESKVEDLEDLAPPGNTNYDEAIQQLRNDIVEIRRDILTLFRRGV